MSTCVICRHFTRASYYLNEIGPLCVWCYNDLRSEQFEPQECAG